MPHLSNGTRTSLGVWKLFTSRHTAEHRSGRTNAQNRDIACEATARRQNAAARGFRLHAAGPWTGGDGAAAPRAIRVCG